MKKIRTLEYRKAYQRTWMKAYRQRPGSRDRHAARTRAYRAKNKQAYIKHIIEEQIRIAMKPGNNYPYLKRIIGCDAEKYKRYLIARFQPGMTWNNRGTVWHIDHKRPFAAFDVTKERDRRKCFHYTNTQPLPCFDNLSKGAKFSGRKININMRLTVAKPTPIEIPMAKIPFFATLPPATVASIKRRAKVWCWSQALVVEHAVALLDKRVPVSGGPRRKARGKNV